MKLVSWNVNGLRACIGKGFRESAMSFDADVICLQETKMAPGQADPGLADAGYAYYWNSANKKGYSGTAVFSRTAPANVTYDLGDPEHDDEGRLIKVEFESFSLWNVYAPNSRDGLVRLPYRMRWEDSFRESLIAADRVKPVVVCGDLNVAHKEIDLKNPRANRRNPGFTDEERGKLTETLDAGFFDSFRELYPDAAGAYTWWSYIGGARSRNAGWRIDYFLVSKRLRGQFADAAIHPDVFGSDHCPVSLIIDAG